MRSFLIMATTLLLTSSVSAQEFAESQPAGRNLNMIAGLSAGLAGESRASVRDLVTFRDPRWTLLTLTQIGVSAADAQTSLHNLRVCPTCLETGSSRWVIG